MKQKYLLLSLSAAAGLLPAVLGALLGSVVKPETLAAPFRMAGEGLRALSLSGGVGNAAAWLVVLVLSALPLLMLMWLRRGGLEKRGEDWLLTLAVPQIFYLLYYLVNPTLLSAGTQMPGEAWAVLVDFLPFAVGGTLLSTVLAWAALRLLRRLESASAPRLAGAFRPLLIACAVLTAFGGVWSRVHEVQTQYAAVLEGNTGAGASLRLTFGMLLVLGVLKLIPDLLAAMTLLWGADLAEVLGRETFGQEAVKLCGRTADTCKNIARASVLAAAFANLLQLMLLGSLHASHFSVILPLEPLMLSVGLFLLCSCLRKGKELQEDSDSII